MEKEHKFGVFCGRFQPFHNGHSEVVDHGLKVAEKLIIIIGSCSAARNIKNPFTFEERKAMIIKSVGDEKMKNIIIRPMKDFFYNENIWTTNVQKIVREIAKDEPRIVVVGSFKDSGSYWLNQFPNFELSTIKATKVNATSIRKYFFDQSFDPKKWKEYFEIDNMMPKTVSEFLENFSTTHEYTSLVEEHAFIEKYKDSWAVAPYAVTFVTVDSIVLCAGHVLVVQRGFNPGKHLFAVPGGFLNQDELIVDGAIRELKEEAGIKIPKITLKNAIVDQKVFDYPGRSLRGRTITHAFCIKLQPDANGELPSIKSGSDASDVFWMEFSEVHENQDKFFEDHHAMISYFLYRNN